MNIYLISKFSQQEVLNAFEIWNKAKDIHTWQLELIKSYLEVVVEISKLNDLNFAEAQRKLERVQDYIDRRKT